MSPTIDSLFNIIIGKLQQQQIIQQDNTMNPHIPNIDKTPPNKHIIPMNQ